MYQYFSDHEYNMEQSSIYVEVGLLNTIMELKKFLENKF